MTTYQIKLEISIGTKRGYSSETVLEMSNRLDVPECCLGSVSAEQLEQMMRLLAPGIVRMLGACAVQDKLEHSEPSVLVPAGQAAAS